MSKDLCSKRRFRTTKGTLRKIASVRCHSVYRMFLASQLLTRIASCTWILISRAHPCSRVSRASYSRHRRVVTLSLTYILRRKVLIKRATIMKSHFQIQRKDYRNKMKRRMLQNQNKTSRVKATTASLLERRKTKSLATTKPSALSKFIFPIILTLL